MAPIQLRIQDSVDDAKKRTVGLNLSTFDIPRSASAVYDQTAHALVIRFQYIDREGPAPAQPLTKDITVVTGKNSGKLLLIRINAWDEKSGQLRVTFNKLADVNRALDGAISSLKRYNQKENYHLIRSVLSSNCSSLVSAAAG